MGIVMYVSEMLVLFVYLPHSFVIAHYNGILMSGHIGGTQVYDPFNSPHAQGNLQLGLELNKNAHAGAAVINGHLAYFASSRIGKIDIGRLIYIYNSSTFSTFLLKSISFYLLNQSG